MQPAAQMSIDESYDRVRISSGARYHLHEGMSVSHRGVLRHARRNARGGLSLSAERGGGRVRRTESRRTRS